MFASRRSLLRRDVVRPEARDRLDALMSIEYG
jgi:hypothetical protein